MQILKMNVIVSGIRTLMAMICQFIYPLISNIYNLFINISKVNILSEQFEGIYQRVTLILTIVMVFYVTFQFVKYVVQPDAMTDKEKGAGKIIYKLIAVIVLIAFVPDIFGFAHKIQDAIIDKNVIGQVILGPTTTTNPSELGSTFSASLFNISYSIDEDKREEKCGDIVCGNLVDMNIKMLANNNDLSYLTMGLDSVTKETSPINSEKVEVPTINFLFHGFLAVAIGLFVGYILVLYCIDVGVRWAQLVYLQIIAPIPIIGFLSPKKDNIFNKWLGQCVTTYLDLFIRQIIIYLILLLSSIILEIYYDPTKGDLLAKVDPSLRKWVFIFLVMGLMLFAHKAPKMISELLPKPLSAAASGKFGLSAKDRGLKGMTRVAGAAAGAVVGGAAGALSGAFQGARRRKSLNKQGKQKGVLAGAWGAAQGFAGGLVGGTARGLASGAKKGNVIKNATAGAKNQIKANQRFGNRQENGYGVIDQIGDRARNISGTKSRAEVQEAQKAPIKRHNEYLKKVEDTRSKIEKRAIDKINEGGKGGAAAQNYLGAQRRLKELQENQELREKEFKVAKFTNDKTAQAAYEADVELAKASVNKANFVDPTTGKLNEEEYNKALNAAASKVKTSNYRVAYKTEEEAQAAYQAAVKDKTDAVDRTQYATEEEYNKALQAAVSTVNAEIYTKGYATNEEAQAAYQAAVKEKTDAVDRTQYATEDEYNKALQAAASTVNAEIYTKLYATEEDAKKALQQEIQQQIKTVDEAKDAAVAEYVAGDKPDGAIVQMLTELQAEIKEYNETAANTEELGKVPVIDYETGKIAKDENGNDKYESVTRRINLASSEDIMKHFDKFTDEVKGGKINIAKNKNATKIIEIDAEIERIKQQTAGSGINEGKK